MIRATHSIGALEKGWALSFLCATPYPCYVTRYWGEAFGAWGAGDQPFSHPPHLPQSFPGFKTHPGFIDETNNTWSCLRTIRPAAAAAALGAGAGASTSGENSLFCVFWRNYRDVDDPAATPYFTEHYEIG